jgi:membrane protein implicated in regulation of membrane protease activity
MMMAPAQMRRYMNNKRNEQNLASCFVLMFGFPILCFTVSGGWMVFSAAGPGEWWLGSFMFAIGLILLGMTGYGLWEAFRKPPQEKQ